MDVAKPGPICKKIVTAPQIFPYLLIYIRIRLYLCIVFHGIRFKVSEDWLSRDNQFFVSCPTHISPKDFLPRFLFEKYKFEGDVGLLKQEIYLWKSLFRNFPTHISTKKISSQDFYLKNINLKEMWDC